MDMKTGKPVVKFSVTHTYEVLDVPRSVYGAVRALLAAADYHHSFVSDPGEDDEIIDMHGIALRSFSRESAHAVAVELEREIAAFQHSEPPQTPELRCMPDHHIGECSACLHEAIVSAPLVPAVEPLLPKAIKLLEALAEPHEKDCNDDHHWSRCRKCLAQEELDHKGADNLLLALLAKVNQR